MNGLIQRSAMPAASARPGFVGGWLAIVLMSVALLTSVGARAQAVPSARPKIMSNRWQEDWSGLSDPALRTEPLDDLKYVPLSADDPHSYLSLGATLRERYEIWDAQGFGTGHVADDSYLLDRAQVHLDVHFDANWQFFTQLEDVRTVDKKAIGPADRNPLDLRLMYLLYQTPLDEGMFKARVGRQDFLFDVQRFVSSRDGPNVRQSFDAVWADWEHGPWRLVGLVSQPVQYRNRDDFDDVSNRHVRFDALRVERHVFGINEWSAYWARYARDGAKFLDALGDERRDVYDMRFAGAAAGLDWDVEAMGQKGSVGGKTVRAWAAGSRVGYTFGHAAWSPRAGLQVDAASGDRRPGDGSLNTFNPLFPNGYYFTQASFTGYANLIHVKPSITVKPAPGLSVMAALGLQWRQTTHDAIYTHPLNAVANTAGQGRRWSGAYAQLRSDYAFDAHLTGAVEAVHYQVGKTLRDAGAHDSEYLGVELKYSW